MREFQSGQTRTRFADADLVQAQAWRQFTARQLSGARPCRSAGLAAGSLGRQQTQMRQSFPPGAVARRRRRGHGWRHRIPRQCGSTRKRIDRCRQGAAPAQLLQALS
ncbi:MAG: hypothetical protein AMXMBFR25_18410 [Lysobacterales bacterium]